MSDDEYKSFEIESEEGNCPASMCGLFFRIRSNDFNTRVSSFDWRIDGDGIVSIEIKLRFYDDKLKIMCFADLTNCAQYVGLGLKPMQFTGSHDSLAEELYEGDVVSFSVLAGDRNDQKELRGLRGVVDINPYGIAFGTWSAEYCFDVRKIGNVHERASLEQQP